METDQLLGLLALLGALQNANTRLRAENSQLRKQMNESRPMTPTTKRRLRKRRSARSA